MIMGKNMLLVPRNVILLLSYNTLISVIAIVTLTFCLNFTIAILYM